MGSSKEYLTVEVSVPAYVVIDTDTGTVVRAVLDVENWPDWEAGTLSRTDREGRISEAVEEGEVALNEREAVNRAWYINDWPEVKYGW